MSQESSTVPVPEESCIWFDVAAYDHHIGVIGRAVVGAVNHGVEVEIVGCSVLELGRHGNRSHRPT